MSLSRRTSASISGIQLKNNEDINGSSFSRFIQYDPYAEVLKDEKTKSKFGFVAAVFIFPLLAIAYAGYTFWKYETATITSSDFTLIDSKNGVDGAGENGCQKATFHCTSLFGCYAYATTPKFAPKSMSKFVIQRKGSGNTISLSAYIISYEHSLYENTRFLFFKSDKQTHV